MATGTAIGKPKSRQGSGKGTRQNEEVQSSLVAQEVMRLVEAWQEGRLSERGRAEQFKGAYEDVVHGVNAILDTVTAPFNLAAGYVGQISKGEVPAKITDAYKGDFNALKNNLNACIDGLGGLLEANSVLQKMANNDYTSRVEGKYEGIFAGVAAAVNVVRERVLHVISTVKNVSQGNLEDLPAYKTIGRRSEHDDLVPALVLMMESLSALVADTDLLTKAALEGKLATRADSAKHNGDYRRTVEGVNATLDAVIGPLSMCRQLCGPHQQRGRSAPDHRHLSRRL